MIRHLIIAAALAVAAQAAIADEVAEDAAKIVAAKHLKKGLALHSRGRLESAEREFDLGITSYPPSPALYGARGKVRYARKNYPGAVQDFDVYLAATPNDLDVILLRGLARSLLKPEDVVGACDDFSKVRAHLKNMGVEKYCAGQAGW